MNQEQLQLEQLFQSELPGGGLLGDGFFLSRRDHGDGVGEKGEEEDG